MKRFTALLASLLVLPAFAEVAPVYYDEAIEYSDEEIIVEDDAATEEKTEKEVQKPIIVQQPAVSPRGASGRTTASRAVPAVNTANTRSAGARVVASSRNATNSGANVRARTATAGIVSRSATNSAATRPTRATTSDTKAAVTTRNTNTSKGLTARVGVRATAGANAVPLTQTDTVNTPLYTGRVTTRAAGAMRARMPSSVSISATSAISSAETMADTVTSMDELSQMTDYCKAQYMSCMDNFCNVLDENQGRCSCSKNLKNYAKTEEALEDATERVQEIMQKIQYIGLSTEQIETIFSQTEAEMALQGRKDNTEIQRDLERTKNMLVDIKTGTASSTTIDTGVNFDLSGLLNFDLASAGTFDLSSMLGSSNIGSTNTSSISNQRGEQLYKTAAARCKTAVLTDCQNHGVDISIITNSYDMEIDKACITYEKNLVAANNQMKKDATNLSSFLQRARLALATQKNAYDLRECVTALDSCMQGDFVCGSDYESCLDPTGKYIVNGEIVVGSTPGATDNAGSASDGLYKIWNHGSNTNPWSETTTLSTYIEASIANNISDISDASRAQGTMTTYLMNKIGYHDDKDDKDFGMCMYVLNQCQDYTYGTDGKYDIDNQVIKEYLHRTLVNIKTAQDNKIAEYAEECISDVVTCLENNNFDLTSQSGNTLSATNRVAIQACKAQITTCMSVNGEEGTGDEAIKKWAIDVVEDTETSEFVTYKKNCESTGGTYSVNDRGTHSCTCPTPDSTQTITYVLHSNGMCINQAVIDTCGQSGTWNANTATCECDEYSKLVGGKCIFDKGLAAAKCVSIKSAAECTVTTQKSLCDADKTGGSTYSYCQYSGNNCSLNTNICGTGS